MKETKPTAPAGGCDTCAFRVGCVTHEDEPHNRLKALICALGGLPFHCHHSTDTDWSVISLDGLNHDEAMTLRRELPICRGWQAEVKALAARGHFSGEFGQVRKYIANHALGLVRQFINSDDDAEKASLERRLDQALGLLKEKADAGDD